MAWRKSFLLFLICMACLNDLSAQWIPQDTAWINDNGSTYPWRLRARTGLWDEWSAQEPDSIVRRVTKYYINNNIPGFMEYLPDGYDDPANGTKSYPLILFVPGCGEMNNGIFYLRINSNNQTVPDYSKGLARIMHSGNGNGNFPAIPTNIKYNGNYFSNIAVKTKGLDYNYSSGEKTGAIVMNLMPFGFPVLPCAPNGYVELQPADIDATIKFAVANYRVDPNRIFLTGMSAGGKSSWFYPATAGMQYPLAGAAPIAAVSTIRTDAALAQNIVNNGTRMLVVCNKYDWNTNGNLGVNTVDYNTEAVDALKAINGAKVDEYFFLNGPTDGFFPIQPDGYTKEQAIAAGVTSHNAWDKAFKERAGANITPDNIMKWPVYTETLIGGGTEDYNIYEWFLQKQLSPTPVTVTQFTASKVMEGVRVAWTTSSESNSSYFTLERSFDGVNFREVRRENAAGTSTMDRNYSWVDKDIPAAKYVYYKLWQTDRDGRKQNFGVRKVLVGTTGFEMRVYPSVATSSLVLEAQGAITETMDVRITDMAGRILLLQKLPARQNRLNIDVSTLSKGMYIIKAEGTKGEFTSKFIKQ